MVGLLVPFLLVPLLVRFLGHERYGEWVVILSMTSYFGLANLGMAQTVGNMVAEAAAKVQHRFLGQVVSTAFFFHALVALPLLLVCVLPAFGYLVRFLPLHTHEAKLALSVTCALAVISLPLKVSAMTLRSLDRVDLEQATQTVSNLVRALALITVLVAGFKLLAVALVHSLALVGTGIATYLLVNRVCDDGHPRMDGFSWGLLRTMLNPSAGFLVLTIASTLVFSIDNLVIAYRLGTKAVTQYAVPFQVVMLSVGFFAVTLGALTPAVTEHHARGAGQLLGRAYLAVTRAAILFSGSMVIFLWIAGKPLLRLWVGQGVFPGSRTFALQLVLLFVQTVLCPPHTVLMATSRHYGYATWAIFEGLLNLVLSLWWVHLWGMPGVIAGTLAARLLTNGWYMPTAALRVIGLSYGDFLNKTRRSAVLAICGVMGAAVASKTLAFSTALATIGAGCGSALAFFVVFIAIEPTSEERLLLLRALRGLRKSIRIGLGEDWT